MKWYTKLNPRQALWLASGASLSFEAVRRDLGVFATDNAQIQAEFAAAIQNSRGGLTEISQAVYDELRKKKDRRQISSRRWREEISPNRRFSTSPKDEAPAAGEVAKKTAMPAGSRPVAYAE